MIWSDSKFKFRLSSTNTQRAELKVIMQRKLYARERQTARRQAGIFSPNRKHQRSCCGFAVISGLRRLLNPAAREDTTPGIPRIRYTIVWARRKSCRSSKPMWFFRDMHYHAKGDCMDYNINAARHTAQHQRTPRTVHAHACTMQSVHGRCSKHYCDLKQ